MKYFELDILTIDTTLADLIGDGDDRNLSEVTRCVINLECIEAFWQSGDELYISMVSGEAYASPTTTFGELRQAIFNRGM